MSYLPPLDGLPSSRRRRRRLVIAGVVVLLTVAGLVIASVGGFIGARQSNVGTSPGAGGYALRQAGAAVVRAGCVDQTGSSDKSFAEAVIQHLADAVAGWPGPQSGPGELLPRPALHLTVRTVSTHSSSTDQPMVQIPVPEVPGLPPPPPAEDAEFAQNRQAWNEARKERAEAWQRASDAATAGITALRSLPLDRNTYSEINGCLAAAAEASPTSSTRQLLLASDLQQNRAAGTGQFAGNPVLVVQSCPAGTEGNCRALADSWSASLTAQGAGPVRFVRADTAAEAIREWMTVTP